MLVAVIAIVAGGAAIGLVVYIRDTVWQADYLSQTIEPIKQGKTQEVEVSGRGASENYSKEALSESGGLADSLKDTFFYDSSIYLGKNMQVYRSSNFGFSISVPKTVKAVNTCGSGSKNNDAAVPVKVYEDVERGMVFIVPEYYYGCDKIEYTLDSLREDINLDPDYVTGPKPSFGWAIQVADVENDADLDKFIKSNYGPGCALGEKYPWEYESGVFEVGIKKPDPDINMDPSCYTNYLSARLYDPEKRKLISINLGQESTFFVASEVPVSYDARMVMSIKFE